MDISSFVVRARKLEAAGASTDEILRRVRADGASPIASIQVLRELRGLTVSEAKLIVWQSPVWADKRPDHDRVGVALDELETRDPG